MHERTGHERWTELYGALLVCITAAQQSLYNSFSAYHTVALVTTSRIGNLTRLIHTLLYVMSVSTIEEGGYDDSVPGEVTKTIPSGNRTT